MSDELEREFADVLGVLRGFEPVDAPAGLEGRIAMNLKTVQDEVDEAPGAARAVGVTLRCVFCHEALARAEGEFCASCLAPHHGDCFREHGRCSALGCEETRTVRPRRSDRTRRARRRRPLAFVGAGLLVGVLSVAAVKVATSPASPPARDEQALLAEYKRLDAEAMEAYRAFNHAEKAGDRALAATKREQAHALWSLAIDKLTTILDSRRGPDGSTSAEYEGYEEELRLVSQLLVDLEKRAAEPADPAYWLARARAHEEAGDLAGARADATRARELDPNDVEAYVLLSRLDFVSGLPATPWVTVMEIETLLREGRIAEAEAAIDRARARLAALRSSADEDVRAALPVLEERLQALDPRSRVTR